jgi:hypothetical protein
MTPVNNSSNILSNIMLLLVTRCKQGTSEREMLAAVVVEPTRGTVCIHVVCQRRRTAW